MRIVFGVLLSIIFSLSVFSQNEKNKSMLLVSRIYYGKKCEYVAFRVNSSKIEIDSCYDINSNSFQALKTISLSDEPFIAKVYEEPTESLLSYEMEINEINCDYFTPISITVYEGEQITRLKWKRKIGIYCGSKSVRNLIEGLQKTFEKYN
ncbi:hypothetical protein [Bernardetia sp.]|uniref:hypothetical protein n=1 Tax=Bernardetia sp. TaxID=1937974 RepID=UPI0025C40E2F|nr:hypothetical protein [Bernardetia sp.]